MLFFDYSYHSYIINYQAKLSLLISCRWWVEDGDKNALRSQLVDSRIVNKRSDLIRKYAFLEHQASIEAEYVS